MPEHPWLRDEDIVFLADMLERDIRYHPHVLSKQAVAAWMDADARFARWVEQHQPGMAEVAQAYRKVDHARS